MERFKWKGLQRNDKKVMNSEYMWEVKAAMKRPHDHKMCESKEEYRENENEGFQRKD